MEFKAEVVENFLSPIQLGDGGFGITYAGHIVAGFGLSEQTVAIKKSHARDAPAVADLELRSQFENELKLSIINHKNIVKLIGYAESEKHFYLLYERIDGRSLEDVIEGEITWKKAIKILSGVAAALRYLQKHPNGPWAHCDLCPANVMVKEDGTPKLLDFGLCVAVGEKKLGGHHGYLFREKEGLASLGTDVFSFGVLAMHLLAKDSRISFLNKDGVEEPIINFYIDQWRERRSIVSRDFGNPKEAVHVSKVVIPCLQKDKLPQIEEIYSELHEIQLLQSFGC